MALGLLSSSSNMAPHPKLCLSRFANPPRSLGTPMMTRLKSSPTLLRVVAQTSSPSPLLYEGTIMMIPCQNHHHLSNLPTCSHIPNNYTLTHKTHCSCLLTPIPTSPGWPSNSRMPLLVPETP